MFTSSTPLVMLPLPSAMNEPMRAKNAPDPDSEPLIEKAYWPLRLALEKLPPGGAGVTTVPPPPQATENIAAERARDSAKRFIAHLPDSPEDLHSRLCWIVSRRAREENRVPSGQLRLALPPAPTVRERRGSSRQCPFGRRNEHSSPA